MRGRERGDAKKWFRQGAHALCGIRSLIQGHSPGGATVWQCLVSFDYKTNKCSVDIHATHHIQTSSTTTRVIQGFHSLGYKKIPGLSRTPEAFSQDPVISQQGLNIATDISYRVCDVSSQMGSRKHFWHTCSPENVPGGNNYRYFRLQKHVYLKPKTDICIIAWQVPGLSRTEVIFQDFPCPGNFPLNIPGLYRKSWLFVTFYVQKYGLITQIKVTKHIKWTAVTLYMQQPQQFLSWSYLITDCISSHSHAPSSACRLSWYPNLMRKTFYCFSNKVGWCLTAASAQRLFSAIISYIL